MTLPAVGDLLSASGGGEVRGETIGRSREDRPIAAHRFGDGPVRVSLVAGCHADEPVGPRLLRRLAALLDGLDGDAAPLRRCEWWVLPHLNPDGAARNRRWQTRPEDGYVLGEYVAGVVREGPADDVEFGFPRGHDDTDARPENRAAFRWWSSAQGPFHVHVSLHGMAVGLGPWFLLEEAWAGRSAGLQARCRELSRALGYRLHDEDRGGDKGFRRISEGFSTRPDSASMSAHFLERGDEQTARQFRPSSMETMRGLGDDALTAVPEMPLFVAEGGPEPGEGPPEGPVGFGWKERWRDVLRGWGRRLRAGDADAAAVEREALERGLRAMPVRDQMALQWELVRAAVLEVEARRFDGPTAGARPEAAAPGRAAADGVPLKRSVSVVVRGPDGSRLLAVRRPPDDEELPGLWGLPAASLRAGESWSDAAARVGPEKLGVELAPGRVLREGEAPRPGRRLRMRLFEAEISAGEPEVPQDAPGVTQYVEWAWAPPSRLREAAARGSLCSRLCLEHLEEARRAGDGG